MVSATFDSEHSSRFVIRPNQSLSWKEAKVFYLGTVVVSMTIAIGFAAQGFWPVLPFAGVELLGLGAALYVSALRASHNEVVSIRGDLVEIEKGRGRPERRWTFHRAWAQVLLQPASQGWYPSRLVIRSHGQAVEVGGFLNEQERACLARDLRGAIAP